MLKRKRTHYVRDKLLARYGLVVVIALKQVHTVYIEAVKTTYDKYSFKTSFLRQLDGWKPYCESAIRCELW